MNNKSEKLWFKRRRYGWGWTPVTWQGWLTIAAFLAMVVSCVFTLPMKPNEPTTGQILLFCMYVVSAILVLLGISFMKGPMPKFRWGKKPTDNPEEDI
ncbi:MAG: hypothetical protein JWO55_448 [Candidatus Saccharibacteria bacterium]|jgi:hypothetical protein|nr:hypothetical protein [Candidatus Saccharibacteria bacterium]